jgi:hypothetical protein
MAEVAKTVTEAGFEPWMSRGCIERQRWAATYAGALKQEALTDMLDDMLAPAPAQRQPREVKRT